MYSVSPNLPSWYNESVPCWAVVLWHRAISMCMGLTHKCGLFSPYRTHMQPINGCYIVSYIYRTLFDFPTSLPHNFPKHCVRMYGCVLSTLHVELHPNRFQSHSYIHISTDTDTHTHNHTLTYCNQ